MILSSNNVTAIIASTILILVVAVSFSVQTYFPNPIAQQIREQIQFFDRDGRDFEWIALDMTLPNSPAYVYSGTA